MSEFKSKKVRVLFGVLLIISIVTVSWALFFDAAYRQNPQHSIILYNSQDDTLLELDTRSEYVKIWIEEDGELDVWIKNEEGGWTKK